MIRLASIMIPSAKRIWLTYQVRVAPRGLSAAPAAGSGWAHHTEPES
jgi:hypothetical protein